MPCAPWGSACSSGSQWSRHVKYLFSILVVIASVTQTNSVVCLNYFAKASEARKLIDYKDRRHNASCLVQTKTVAKNALDQQKQTQKKWINATFSSDLAKLFSLADDQLRNRNANPM